VKPLIVSPEAEADAAAAKREPQRIPESLLVGRHGLRVQVSRGALVDVEGLMRRERLGAVHLPRQRALPFFAALVLDIDKHGTTARAVGFEPDRTVTVIGRSRQAEAICLARPACSTCSSRFSPDFAARR